MPRMNLKISPHFSGFILFTMLKRTHGISLNFFYLFFKILLMKPRNILSVRRFGIFFFQTIAHPAAEQVYYWWGRGGRRDGRYLIFQKYFDQILYVFPPPSPLKPQRGN